MGANPPAQKDMLATALAYAERGWAVLPVHRVDKKRCSCGQAQCKSPGKHPMTAHGVKDATTERGTIIEWWSKHPEANIGIAAGQVSELLIIDIDPRNGGDDSFDELLTELGPLPDTLEVLSGGGGQHLYFQLPPGSSKIRTKFATGIEALADGFYVVAPPSLHPSGRAYEWEVSSVGLPPAILPGAWLQRISQPLAKTKPESPGTAHFIEGERNTSLAKLAGQLRQIGLDEVELRAALRAANERRCSPPLELREVDAIASSIARYAVGAEPRLTAPQAIDVAAFLNQEYVYPESLIGKGLLVPGGLALLAGRPGIGKTWLTLDLLLATMTGDPWLEDLDLPVRACRAALISMELPAFALHERLNTLRRAKGIGELPANAGWVLPDAPAAAFCLPTKPAIVNLEGLIRQHSLELLLLDPFSRFHISDENAAKEVGEVLKALDSLRHDTGCAILLVHHVRKVGEGSRDSGGLDAVRGSSRLVSDPQTVLLFTKRQHGFRLTTEKINLGPDLGARWFAKSEAGGFVPTDAPMDRISTKASNLDLVSAILREAGSIGLSTAQLAAKESAPKVREATLLAYLRTLKQQGLVDSEGGRKNCRWFWVGET